MEKSIIDFPQQFNYQPKIVNASKLKKCKQFIVAGMGGSHLSAGLLKTAKPELDLLIHRDYGLPRVPKYFLKGSLIIASSYSGNTEEVIDCLRQALKQKLAVAVITTGGQLLKLAQKHNLPYIQMPATDIQPRLALGYSLISLLKLIGDNKSIKELSKLTKSLNITSAKKKGESLAKKLSGQVPIIYSSTVNLSLAYNWKIKFNETGKIPAFYNVLPELNHNEMTGFDYTTQSKSLSSKYHFIFLTDSADHKRIQIRTTATKKILTKLKLPVTEVTLASSNIWQKIFTSLLIADFTALNIALTNKAEPEQVPLVEKFKKLIK